MTKSNFIHLTREQKLECLRAEICLSPVVTQEMEVIASVSLLGLTAGHHVLIFFIQQGEKQSEIENCSDWWEVNC